MSIFILIPYYNMQMKRKLTSFKYLRLETQCILIIKSVIPFEIILSVHYSRSGQLHKLKIFGKNFVLNFTSISIFYSFLALSQKKNHDEKITR